MEVGVRAQAGEGGGTSKLEGERSLPTPTPGTQRHSWLGVQFCCLVGRGVSNGV